MYQACTIFRVRCNGRGHLPTLRGRDRYVGWRMLRRPRYHVVDMALNPAREAVGLPQCIQHEVGADTGRHEGPWYVPKDGVTVLRPRTVDEVRYYAKAIAQGDLVAADAATAMAATIVWDGIEQAAHEASLARLQADMAADMARRAAT